MAKPVYVGVDDGHSEIKLFTETGEYLSFPSRIKTSHEVISGVGEDTLGLYTTEEGNKFTVSIHLTSADDTRFDGYPTSEMNRVLVHHALLQAGFSGRDVIVATGLPVRHTYFTDGSKNSELITAKSINIAKGVSSANTPMAKILKNTVETEAIAAYVDQILDMDGSPSAQMDDFENEYVGVIDVGGRTTDCIVVYPGGSGIDAARSGSADAGFLKIHETVASRLKLKFGLNHLAESIVDSAVRTGALRVAGQKHDVTDIVDAEKKVFAQEIAAFVRTKIGSGRDLNVLLLVGGGALAMREQLLEMFPHATIPKNPEFANARGMMKMAKYLSPKTRIESE